MFIRTIGFTTAVIGLLSKMKNWILLFIIFYSCSENQNGGHKPYVSGQSDTTGVYFDSVYNVMLSELLPISKNGTNRFMSLEKLGVDSIDLKNQNLIWNLKIINERTSYHNDKIKLWFTRKSAETDSTRDYGFYFIMNSEKKILSERFRFRINEKSREIKVNICPGAFKDYMTMREWQIWDSIPRDE